MERRAISIAGTVQGVGFRPFVYTLASRFDLSGFVRNSSGGVQIEVEGDSQALDRFLARLEKDPPRLARIDELHWERRTPLGDRRFQIEQSDCTAAGSVVVSPDVAVCDDCLAELFNPTDRRYRYPFLNCTNCGPRLTIVTGAPYDRTRTTMASFPMCSACRSEYEDPNNRRFHAQPTACPVCGPRLALTDSAGQVIEAGNPLETFTAALFGGKIGALKGLGGFHLVCNARNEQAVTALRRRKHRDEKPFAIMVADVAAARLLCEIAEAEESLLTCSRRPIVLLKKRADAKIADAVAPGNPFLGVMLPYTPLHHLLMRAAGGAPLVMTSGNRSDEPIAVDDSDAISRLNGIADLFLLHDRPIHVRCDDSVTRIVDGAESPVRRSRGYAPQPIRLGHSCAVPMLAVGGQMKATFALGRDRHAIVSHHLGDLDHYEAFRAFERDVALYEELFAVRPEMIVHDLHPDYASSRYAIARAQRTGASPVRLLAVQHHHAHLAACMAEHGLAGPAIGVTFDGTGLGTDGAIWGGEFLVGDCRHVRRAAHLRYVGMPGGEQAVREPWRLALAHLVDAGCDIDEVLGARVPAASLRTALRMLERKFNSPLTSSAGRLFDAIASLLGIRDRVCDEGQAAIELEWLAMRATPDRSYPFGLTGGAAAQEPIVIDTRPLIGAIVAERKQGIDVALIARRFHSTMAAIISAVCVKIAGECAIQAVALSGGVFLNSLLAVEAADRLTRAGLRVYRHRLVPPNDGGLSLGQIAVAAANAGELLPRRPECASEFPGRSSRPFASTTC